jgi:hypothetical protein
MQHGRESLVADQPDETEPGQPFGAINFGKVFSNPPVPHVPGNTLMFEAGPITIGVEYRLLNEEILAQVYGAEHAAEIIASRFGNPDAGSAHAIDSGVSLHVFDAGTGAEHLRFDDLDSNKHYHYLRSDGRHVVVWYDDVANGDLVTWALASLRDRVSQMLELAGAAELAGRIDRDAVARALGEVEVAVRAQAAAPAI